MSSTPLRDFLEIPYDQLEEMNLEAKEERLARRARRQGPRAADASTCTDEKRIKAVTVCFTDLEGRLHMLDYDKKFLLKSADNLTFDGSSIRGFSRAAGVGPAAGDRLAGLLLAAVGRLRPRQGAGLRRGARARRHARTAPTCAALLKAYTDKLYAKDGTVCHAANEIEGFLFKGRDAERHYHETGQLRVHLAPAATTTRCRATRCGSSSTPPPRCSARWASPTRRTTRRWRPRSSR